MSYSFQGWEHDLDNFLTTDPRYEVEPVCKCHMCGGDIYDGDTVYKISGEIYCERCIEDCQETMEAEEE